MTEQLSLFASREAQKAGIEKVSSGHGEWLEEAMSEKRRTHKEALLQLLSDHQPHHMSECIKAGGYRYGGRLHELRKEGREIETIRLGDDEFAYRYVRFAHPVEPEQLAMSV